MQGIFKNQEERTMSRVYNFSAGPAVLPEEVLKDEEGMQTMRTLGRNMAFLMKSIRMGKEKLGLPQKEQTIFTSFHR